MRIYVSPLHRPHLRVLFEQYFVNDSPADYSKCMKIDDKCKM